MCQAQDGVHLNEDEFIFEVVDPDDANTETDEGELVVSNLGRIGMPVIRYRTGDYVRLNRSPCSCGGASPRIDGGIIGRIDDLLIIRGINLYPSAIENLIRSFPDIDEFAVSVHQSQGMDEIEIQIEGAESTAKTVQNTFRERFGLRAVVKTVAAGTLPRYELKARRFIDHRGQS
jgi:phenylacetate-CoA ligase